MVMRLVRTIKQMVVIENLKKIKYGFKPSSDQAVFWQNKLYTPHWICFDWQLLDFISYQLGIRTPDRTENDIFVDMLYAGDCSWS